MSASNTTTNYGLPIYGANDIPKWDDTNTPFGNIDTALKGVVDDLTASDSLKFKFTKSGSSYGYLDVNGNFVPFKSPTGNKSITINTVGTTSGIDVSDYATVSVTTDGLSKPTGDKSITISSTGTTSNIDVADYATASVTTSGLSPTPSGTKYIYSNGSYDVTNYASASVSVSSSASCGYVSNSIAISDNSSWHTVSLSRSVNYFVIVCDNPNTDVFMLYNTSGSLLASLNTVSVTVNSSSSISIKSKWTQNRTFYVYGFYAY